MTEHRLAIGLWFAVVLSLGACRQCSQEPAPDAGIDASVADAAADAEVVIGEVGLLPVPE